MQTRNLTELTVNLLNPRGEVVVDESLRELADSIRTQGVLQPIVITPQNVIVAGHRRVKAASLAGTKTIPVVVKNLTESEQVQTMLIENLQREDLNILQTVKAYGLLINYGLKVAEIAKAVGLPKGTVERYVDILKLTPEVHGCFDGEKALPLAAIPSLLRLTEKEQVQIARRAVNLRWTADGIKRIVTAMKDGGQPRHISHRSAGSLDVVTLTDRLEAIHDVVNDPRLKVVRALIRQAIETLYDLREDEVKQRKTA